jgi:hypothetical protein
VGVENVFAKLVIATAALVFSMSPGYLISAQEGHQVTVANWSFQVTGAVKAPRFSEVVHLGALDDGRDWLIVTLTGTNTSDEEQEIHSDKIHLEAGGESIKQTGQESENVANELGFTTIGGSFPTDVEAGRELQIVQVYKVAPELSDFSLVFDFNGKWEVSISDLAVESAGNPRALAGETSSSNASLPSETSDPWSIRAAEYQLTLIGAVKAPTFSGPFHLGTLEDGRSWLVVTYQLHNTTADQINVASESISILSEGEAINQAGDETRSVAAELELVAPSVELGSDETSTVVQVFKVDPEAADNTLQVNAAGKWFMNLRPVTEAANGDAGAVLPDSAIDLIAINANSSAAQVIPTPAPTPTPEPTPVPEPTELPRYGSADNPGQIGDMLEVDGLAATALSGFYTYEYNFSTPRGGYVFLILEVQFENVSDENIDYNSLHFAARDIDTEIDFDDTFALLDTPLGSGELSPGEYVYGQVALEIQETADSVRVKYTVSPGIFNDSEAMYWMVPRQ